MPKFFVKNEQITDNKITIIGEDVNHIKNVLRLKTDDNIHVCNVDTSTNYTCGISKINNGIFFIHFFLSMFLSTLFILLFQPIRTKLSYILPYLCGFEYLFYFYALVLRLIVTKAWLHPPHFQRRSPGCLLSALSSLLLLLEPHRQ